MIRRLMLSCTLAALPTLAVADTQAIRQGADLTTTQVGHAFAAGCATRQPSLLKATLALWTEAFWFVPQADTGHDFAFVSPNRMLTVTADVGTLEATCTMSVSSEIGGDGSEILQSLETHMADRWWRESPVEIQTDNNGTRWSYTRQGVAHQIDFVKTDQGFLITHKAERL